MAQTVLQRLPVSNSTTTLEDTLSECVAELSTSSPAPDDLWYQARLAFAQFLRAWIRLEESRLATMSADPPAVCQPDMLSVDEGDRKADQVTARDRAEVLGVERKRQVSPRRERPRRFQRF